MGKKTLIGLTLVFVLLYSLSCNESVKQSFVYPATSEQPVTDTIFGKVITDNYRWMEDLNSQKMKSWLKKQADFTDSILKRIPGRDSLIEDFRQLDKLAPYEILGPLRGGNRYFYGKTLAGENTVRLFYREGETGKEVLLFDPLTYKGSGTDTVKFWILPSKDGKKLVLYLRGKTPHINTTRIFNVDSKTFYPETIYPGSLAEDWTSCWTPDSKGIIYLAPLTSDYNSPEFSKDNRAMYHEVGTDPKSDRLIMSRQHDPQLNLKPEEIIRPGYSADGKYIIANLFSGWQDRNRQYFAPASDLFKEKINWKPLVRPDDTIHEALVYDDKVYLFSRKNAPKGKLLMARINDPDLTQAKTIIPEEEKNIDRISGSKDYIFISKSDGINTFIDQYNLKTGEIKSVMLPLIGSAWLDGFDSDTNDCILYVSSWKQSLTQYIYNPAAGKSSISPFQVPVNYPGIDDLTIEEVEATGHDGVMIPLSLVYNKNIKRDGNNIVYMEGYGSYGFSNTPWFYPPELSLLNRGVIIAHTHPRGGGEKGEQWHKAGFKTTKPNTWKDFISCAEYLIKNKYTSPHRIIGEGGSAGGILIGRAIEERPDLFAASIHRAPVSNSLRHENRTIGGTDANEFGTVKDSVEAMALIEMDAYLNVKKGVAYPAVLAVAGMNDNIVPAWQPGKLIAALQRASASERPSLLFVDYHSGHNSDEKYMTWYQDANKYAFGLWQAGHIDFQPLQK